MRLSFIIVCLAASLVSAASLPEGQNLLKLGLYGGAEDVFRQLEATNPTAETTRGLLRTLLAQGKTEQAQEVLESKNAQQLPANVREFYTQLVRLQAGTAGAWPDIDVRGLDDPERNWWNFAQGLKAFAAGDYASAEAAWKILGTGSEAYAWGRAMMGTGNDDAKALDKRMKKMRRQDWPVVRAMILGLLARGERTEARALIEKNATRLPRSEAGLLRALSWGEKTPERAEALMGLLPGVEDQELLAVVVGYCLGETTINLNDVEQQLGDKVKEPTIALILAGGWVQKGVVNHAYDLLAQSRMAQLPAAWQSAYYSTLGSLAANTQPPRYREAAGAWTKWRELPGTTADEKKMIDLQIADAFYKNGDYADAAKAYEANESNFQAVLAWLKAGKPDEAKRLLTQETRWLRWSEGLLAYLLDVDRRGASVEEAYAPWQKNNEPIATRWPIEYLRVESLEKKSAQAALDKLSVINDIPTGADYKRFFDLKKYRLLVRLQKNAEANAFLDTILQEGAVPGELAMVALSRALGERKPERVMELLPRVGTLTPGERVGIMLLVADQMGNPAAMLEKIQTAIEQLPSAERAGRLLGLARGWAQAGRVDRARSIVEALQESKLEGYSREEVDFLRATLDEMEGNPLAENQWLLLSQRDNQAIKIRSLAHLAAYYANQNRPRDAQTIFYAQLSLLLGDFPPALQEHRDEILKAFTTIANVLPAPDARRVRDWVEAQAIQTPPAGQ